jgi:hypothetical protein
MIAKCGCQGESICSDCGFCQFDCYCDHSVTVEDLINRIKDYCQEKNIYDMHFHYDDNTNLWCFSGLTNTGLYFETDDVFAENKIAAINAAYYSWIGDE